MPTIDFAHLHVHTEYSLLDGFSRIQPLIAAAQAQNMKHLAMTDHGAMYGALDFYTACKAGGINPIIGIEAYLVDDMLDHSKKFSSDYSHLVMVAKNNEGYRNLLALTTIAHTKGYHYRPRIDKAALAEHSAGLIVTSSCISGEIPKMLLAGDTERAYKTAQWYRDVFGPQNFYLEIQEHHGIYEDGQPSPQAELNQMLYQMHKDLAIPLVATNDLHYIHPEDSMSQDFLLCVQTGKKLDDPKRMKFDSQEYYLRSGVEMQMLFPELPGAIRNSIVIAEQCNVNPFEYHASLPACSLPDGWHNAPEYVYHLAIQGLRERYGKEKAEEYKSQLNYEFQMVNEKGFIPYFLIEWDFVNYARKSGIRCSARGSAAGSILAYSLGITNIDPIRYKLPFERFFNSERADMPDIDMDFPDNRREEVIQYVTQKYGADRVAQICTFNTMAAKQAIRDTGRVFDQFQLSDALARMVPSGPGVTLTNTLAESKELQSLYGSQEMARNIVDQAMKLEGSIRNTGVHAAALIMSNRPLAEIVPLQLRNPKDPESGLLIQYEQKWLEQLGLIKFDFLGLSNLAIVDRTLKFIEANRGETVVLEKVPLEPCGDEEQDIKRLKAYELLSNGDTTGIFQLEGPKMTEYIKMLKPTRLEDIMAMIALYRPGPMDSIPDFILAKHGRKQVEYLDPRLAEWLEESYGIIVYQDQVLFICIGLAGFTWGKANKFRKALSKKIMSEVETYKSDFVEGCVHNQVSREVAEKLFSLIMPFGGYGFNKAHAASYAVIAFYTAYLKANYTQEFMAATMTTEANNEVKISSAIAECRQANIEVLAPDVNVSETGFTLEGKAIRFGLLSIKGVGENPVRELMRVREEDPFSSLLDLCTRCSLAVVRKNTLEALIKVGACDAFGERNALLAVLEETMDYAKEIKKGSKKSLAGKLVEPTLPRIRVASKKTILTWERELLGFYISEHPLFLYDTAEATHRIKDIDENMENQYVSIAGSIIEVKTILTKRGESMCFAKLEDPYGKIPITVFANTYGSTSLLWKNGAMVLVSGTLHMRNGELQLVCNGVSTLQEGESAQTLTLNLLPDSEIMRVEANLAAQVLKAIIPHFEGDKSLIVAVDGTEWYRSTSVSLNKDFRAKIVQLLELTCLKHTLS